MKNGTAPTSWPKTPPALLPEQEAAREKFMLLWHERLPSKYSLIERFNQGALTQLPTLDHKWRTLEIGAGIGGHLSYEDLSVQDYHCLEVREEFCRILERLDGIASVVQCSIEEQTTFATASLDRVVAIHVLEHLRDLPSAIREVDRILSRDGIFDVVLPCEGGAAYGLARNISAKRFFESRFGMSYAPIIANEHVNTLHEVRQCLGAYFDVEHEAHFPINIPVDGVNLCVAMRLRKKERA